MAEVIKLWEDNESPTDTDYQQATKFCGGQTEQLPHTTKEVLKALQMATSDLQCMLDERAVLCDKQKGILLVCHAITATCPCKLIIIHVVVCVGGGGRGGVTQG